MTEAVVVDYGMCNLDSMARAVEECGSSVRVTSRPADVRAADRVILPGVGAFAVAMANLRRAGLDDALRDAVTERGASLLGVCLGMQLLASSGLEGGATEGLSLLPGEVLPLEPSAQERVPHVGWNEVRGTSSLLAGVPDGSNFYFVHGFHLVTDDHLVTGRTPYCGGLAAVVESGMVFGVQFHPEKSQRVGLALIRNFLLI